MGIRAATREYERWLARALHGDIVEADLTKKHKKMRDSAFAFLRATYWRWAETILEVCPDLSDAPAVLAVGDTHLENFGTWRDDDGRLIWGVNDYDECAEMPYILDLVRLAASAALAATPAQISLKAICTNLFSGYEQGVEAPEAFVLDRRHLWLRKRFVVGEADRAKFWQKIENQYHQLLGKKIQSSRPPAGSNCSRSRCRNPRSRWLTGGTARAPAVSAARAGSATAPGAAGRCCASARNLCRPVGREHTAKAAARA